MNTIAPCLARSACRAARAPGGAVAVGLLVLSLVNAQAQVYSGGPLPPNGPGFALSFDGGDDYVDVPDGVWFSGDFTVEGWVFVRSYNNWSRLLDFGNGENNNNILVALTDGTTGRPHFHVVSNSFTGPGISTPGSIPLNQWTHLACVLSGATGTIYVNGTAVSNGPMNRPVNIARGSCYLGRSNWPLDAYANAIFDEIRIWNVARTGPQVQANMRRQLWSNESGLVGYWRLDEDSGINAFDATGRAGNTATLVNGPAWAFSTISPFVPSIETAGADRLQPRSVRLHGLVEPNGATSTGYFEWGATTNYGNITSGLGLSDIFVGYWQQTLTNLTPGTTYHFRAVATNSLGASYGLDESFVAPLVFTVSNTNTSGPGSLDEAIAAAASGDRIVIPSGVTGGIFSDPGPVFGDGFAINKDLTIEGPGAHLLTLTGNQISRVFTITGGRVRISGVTIANGWALGASGAPGSIGVGGPGGMGNGGGILNLGDLTLFECMVNDNLAGGGTGGLGGRDSIDGFNGDTGGTGGAAFGGGICNSNRLTLLHCTFFTNRCNGGLGGPGSNGSQQWGGFGGTGGGGGTAQGGAIFNAGWLAATNCTFFTNQVRAGSGGNGGQAVGTPGSNGGNGGHGIGGALFDAGTSAVVNCTISGGVVSGGMGGLAGSGGVGGGGSAGSAGSGTGGGIFQFPAPFISTFLRNSLVAGNSAATAARDLGGSYFSGGFNLLGVTGDFGLAGFTNTTDQLGTVGTPINPVFGPFGSYGGTTWVLPVTTNSPAADKGHSSGAIRDQRGFMRPRDLAEAANGAGDGADIGAFELHRGALYLVTNTLAGNVPGSLWNAISNANLNFRPDTIAFNIPGTGPHTIALSSPLPHITSEVTIDGYTQPGAIPWGCGTNPAVLRVELNGVGAIGNKAVGLGIFSSNCIIRGLALNRFPFTAITIDGSSNRIEGNFVGANITGTIGQPNGEIGIWILGGSFNIVGGVDSCAQRNVILSNRFGGVYIDGSMNAPSVNNVIAGNFIGLDATGTNAPGNLSSGVGIGLYSRNNSVLGNFIAGNSEHGVAVGSTDPNSDSNVIQGNVIGLDYFHRQVFGNGHNGIDVWNSRTNLIAGNVIAGSGSNGVHVIYSSPIYSNSVGNLILSNVITFNDRGVVISGVSSPTNNVIQGNSIHSNTNLGIDLGADGVTDNDSGDGDGGPNNLQNFPVLTRATRSGNFVQVDGSFNSAATRSYKLEFFSSSSADASGYGEGESFLGSAVVATDGAGGASFSFTFAANVPAGSAVTATATDSSGNTSEFSPAIPLADSTTGLVFTVTSTFDFGAGSLRQAILDANSVPGLDTIAFNVVGGGFSAQSALPTITDPVVIDGYTQPGAVPAGNGQPATGLFEINGGPADNGIVHGLHIQTSNCVVRGLTIGSFSGYAIWLDNAPGNRIEGNHIGTDEFDADNIGNGLGGILISNSPNNTVGGTNEAARNVISGNNGHGILITGASASNNVVSGNYAGVDASGLSAIGNDLAGVLIADAPGNIIGGINSMSEGNVISGNNGHGLLLSGAGASNNIVNGNFIGTDATGNGALGNFGDGVVLMGSPHNGIGANNGSPNINIISGNSGSGVRVENAFDNFIGGNNGIGWSFHAVRGPMANGADGVLLTNASANLVGYNKLSGNTRHGLRIAGSGSVSNIVAYNHVGGLGHGYVAPNGLGGILIENAAATRVLENSVMGNDGGGVALVQAANTRLQLNLIGQANPGQSNLNYGVLVQDSTGVSVEGGNIISGNAGPGVAIMGDLCTVAISQCSIFANSGLGIDLGGDGVTLNDTGDADDSPNHFQNFPVLTAASSGSNTIVVGTLNSTANTMFRLEFFGNASVDGTGYGEGQTFLGATNVTTDGSGNASFTFRTPLYVAPGQFVTATATDPAGNTSEFGQARQVAGAFRIGVQGGGGVSKSPDKAAYAVGENVTLTATNSQYHQFVGWSDGNTNPVRTVTVGATNLYVALFTNTVPLETLVFKQWERTYGGTNIDFPWAAFPVPTGGWLVGGLSLSDVSGNKTSPNFGGNDPWLLHVDDDGAVLWDRDYGTTNDAEFIRAIVPLGDEYLLVGQIGNLNPDYWVPDGDVLLIRIDAAGAVQWQRRLGGDGWDYITSAVATRDGGVMVVGSSDSNPGGDKTSEHWGSFDGWLLKLDANGNKLWDRSYGGTSWDSFESVVELSDGSLVLAGWTKPGPWGNYDVWAVKVDAGGVTIWDQVYGSSGIELGGTILPLADGGFLIGASAAAPGEGGNRTASGLGGDDYWLIRIDAAGNKMWDRTYGGSGDEWPWKIQPRPDGSFILIGVSTSDKGVHKSAPNYGGFDVWMLGVDASGNVRWDYSLGGSQDESLHLDALLDTPDGGWLVSGSSSSPPSGNKESPNYGTNDAWVIKLATREAPVGTPAILVNGRFHPGDAVTVSNVATVEIQTSLSSGTILYTLDGSDPRNGRSYAGPFPVAESGLVRAIAFNSSSAVVEADPVLITVAAPPVILVQPRNQTVVLGDAAFFTVTASGSAPLRYQWIAVQGEIISLVPNATNATLAIVASGPAPGYFVTVSNAFGGVTSQTAVLTVLQPVFISTQPANTNVQSGSNATFCVEATGTGPFVYQWRRNGVNISGATNACLTVSNVQLADGASYVAVVANAAGTQVSDPAQLVVSVTSVSESPGDHFADAGLLIGVTGTESATNAPATKESGEPPHAGRFGGSSVWYRWLAPVSGIARFSTVGNTFDTLLAVYTGTNVAQLREVASDDDRGGSLASEVRFNAVSNTIYHIAIDGFNAASGHFALHWELEETTDLLPEILTHPADRLVPFGATVIFSVVASPATNTFQWLSNGVALPGQTGMTLTIENVQPEHIGFYSVRVTRGIRSLESKAAVLEIGVGSGVSVEKIEDPPASEGGGRSAFQPASVGGLALGTIGYHRVTSGNTDLPNCLPGSCNTNITQGARAIETNSTPRTKGLFLVEATNATRTVLWACALVITNRTRFVSDCDEGSDPGGRTAIRFEGIPGNRYDFWMARLDNTNAPVHIAWAFGLPPVIANPPSNQFVLAGGTAQLTVQATNVVEACTGCEQMGGPDFHWFFKGQPLPGATGSTLLLTNVQPAQAGTYTVVVSNVIGTVSNNVTLVVARPAPALRGVSEGGGGSLDLHIYGNENSLICPVSFEWRRNGVTLPDETTGVLSFRDATVAAEGDYLAIVSTCAGSFTSSVTRVRVEVPFRLGGAMGFGTGGFGFDLTGNPGQRFLIRASDDLVQWIDIHQAEMTEHTNRFTDTNAHLFTRRYYQARPLSHLDPVQFTPAAGSMLGVLTGPAGHSFVLEASTNLSEWVPVYTNYYPSLDRNFTNRDSANYPRRFFRANPIPPNRR